MLTLKRQRPKRNGAIRHWLGEYVASPVYIREMKRYGVLPEDFDPATPLDPLQVDQDNYRLFYPEINRP